MLACLADRSLGRPHSLGFRVLRLRVVVLGFCGLGSRVLGLRVHRALGVIRLRALEFGVKVEGLGLRF